jgi:hypothetical protein
MSAMAAPAVSASHSLAASAVPVTASWLYPLYVAGNRTRTLRLMEDLQASRQALQKERVAGNNAQRQGTTSKENRMCLSILINCSDPTVSHD